MPSRAVKIESLPDVKVDIHERKKYNKIDDEVIIREYCDLGYSGYKIEKRHNYFPGGVKRRLRMLGVID